ncbi:MAG: hypothetical protein J0I33_07785 [Microbacterium ginsengisoli]|uniref:hypothetical protein n=1 Tax=Microbacterium TaxID=33882 RepID=UPI0006FE2F03|nr:MULTISPECIES: hypothetical protein [unclassified Microbacterium]KQR97697.1 hypothetical protein ASF93_13290 [Microbacterium sp. Leaf347]KQS01720.1 hypothetical protein ASG00_09805 [Microbacterium sp. Leaf351]MBN9198524.1 hypothetical protein [Microbacterium ginsengisoli]OJU78092.1 MAG: hypothetical protein BGO15_02510 [Microbacterium sp. 71-23]
MSVNEGPTTVGSIVGKLRMDRDEWVAQLAATKKDIHDIESADPNIRVGATTGEAVAKLAAVEQSTRRVSRSTDTVTAAQARLTTAMHAADTAYARAQLAQMRLTELQDRGVTTGSRFAAAELAVTEALRRLDVANEKATASEVALTAAQQAAAAAALEEASAQDDVERSTVKANEANRTNVTRVGAIAAAVALLVPLLAPVGAVAVGVAGALLGMGSAGVLALFGIRKEMQDGTVVGGMYRNGLSDLKGIFDTLSRTAAVNMLGSFRDVVSQIRADMPMLNTQVGQFSVILGRTGSAAIAGTISSLRVLNPLFLTAGLYVQSLAEGFQRWASGSGIEKFAGYALSMLPTVTDVLGKLAAMVMHILEALAPLGQIGLTVLSGIATAIDAIPVDVLSQLIVTITWGAVAFKAWGFIAPMLASIASTMGAVGVASTIATGPVGWIVAGLSALAGVFAVVIAQQTDATQAMQDYTAAVQADNGVIGENVRQKAAQKLADAGAYANAKLLGISTQVVTQAVLGNADAQKKLNEALGVGRNQQEWLNQTTDKTGQNLLDVATAAADLTTAVNTNRDAISGEITRNKELQDALGDTTEATNAQTSADTAAAAALGISVSAIQAARASQKDMKSSTEEATAQMYLQGDAAGLLKQQLDLLNGKAISTADAQNRFDSSLANMGAHIDKTGKDVKRATTNLEGMSAAAVANRGELISSVQAAQNAAQAYRDNGASSEDARKKLVDMKKAIIEHAVELGEDRKQVEAFVNSIFQIPAEVPKTKVEVDTAAANAQIAALQKNLEQLSRNIDIAVKLHGAENLSNVTGGVAFANGGTPRGLAGGGGGSVLGRGTAGSDTAGLYRLANGEEVTSNVFGQADRNRALLKQINAGYTPTIPTMQQAPQAVKQKATEVHIHVSGVNQEDPRVLGAVVGGEVGRQLRVLKK